MPAILKRPDPAVQLTADGDEVSVQITTFSLLLKHGSCTVTEPLISVAWPAQLAPDDMVKPPNGPYELIVVGGGVGSGGTIRQPQTVIANTADMIARIVLIAINP